MRRVSSRQRIALWDSFEAVSLESDGDDSYDGMMEDVTLKRKRLRLKQSKEPRTVTRVIPAYDWEIDRSDAPPTDFPLNSLNDDMAVSVMEFCDLRSIRDLMQVNHRYRDLITSDKSALLWKSILCQKWKWIPSNSKLFIDSLHLPTVAAHNATTNFGLLMSLAAAESPTCIDETCFAPCRWGQNLRRLRTMQTAHKLELETVAADDGSKAVRFTGIVGVGDRCIRSDQPLPRPRRIYTDCFFESLEDLMLRFSPLPKEQEEEEEDAQATPEWKPFVAPFVAKMDDDGRPIVNLSPRLISYFEVSIMAAPAEDLANDALGQMRRGFFRFEQECTAIGLANEYFSLHTRMPGWDSCSYGYHGDDGGIFHATGHMLREYGPTFGVGDVIGCGIDYHERAIFYTHNGKFLGYAFTSLSDRELQKNWYPVVGIDSKSVIKCNFGQSPYVFDLEGMLEKSKFIVRTTILGAIKADDIITSSG